MRILPIFMVFQVRACRESICRRRRSAKGIGQSGNPWFWSLESIQFITPKNNLWSNKESFHGAAHHGRFKYQFVWIYHQKTFANILTLLIGSKNSNQFVMKTAIQKILKYVKNVGRAPSSGIRSIWETVWNFLELYLTRVTSFIVLVSSYWQSLSANQNAGFSNSSF